MKWKESYFVLLVQRCWPWKFCHCCCLGWCVQNCRSSLPKRGSKGESGGEGWKEQFVGIDPPIPAFLSSTPTFLVWWVLHTTHNALHWCRLGRGVYGLTSCCCLHAFLIKKKKECLWFYLPGAGLKFVFARVGKEKCESICLLLPLLTTPHWVWLVDPDILGKIDGKKELKACL